MIGRKLSITALTLAAAGAAALTIGPAAGERGGRYAMQPTEGGFLRLDTETGSVSLCAKRGTAFSCEPVQDEAGLQKEVDRLSGENKELRADIKRLEGMLGLGDGKVPDGDRQAQRGPKLELPTEQDVDKALDYIERMYRKFRDRIRAFEREEGSRKDTPL